jgi:K+-sensing histidine kinase KdpD
MSPSIWVSFFAGWVIGPMFVKLVRTIRDSDVPAIVAYCVADWYQVHHRRYHLPSVTTLNVFLGTATCILASIATCLLGHTRYDDLFPLAFVVVVIVCTHYFGSVAGILGTLASAGIFAWVLYPPASFAVDDPIARATLSIMVVTSTAYSILIIVREHRGIQAANTPQ